MKKRLRYTLIGAGIVLGLVGLVFSEYLKMSNGDSRSVIVECISAIFLGLGILLTAHSEAHVDWYQDCGTAISVVALITGALYGYNRWKARGELSQLLQDHGRCESVFTEIPMSSFSDPLKLVQEDCRLRALKAVTANLTLEEADARFLTVAKLLKLKASFNETTLVTMLYEDSNLERRKRARDEATTLLAGLEQEFSVLEGVLSILQIYSVQGLYDTAVPTNGEMARVKKLVELSTLGRVLGKITNRARSAMDGVSNLVRATKEKGAKVPGELELLDSRAQSLRLRFNQLFHQWDLPAKLESLNIRQTYPAEYQKIHQEVTIGDL